MNSKPDIVTNARPAGTPAVRSGTLLAFSVTTAHLDVNVLVFARDRSHAKRVAQRSEWVSEGGVEWIDLRVSREPKADKYAPQFGETYISAETADEQRVLRELGWYQLESTTEECQVCHKHEWDLVLESKLQDVDGYTCAGCLKANDQAHPTAADSERGRH